MDLAVDDRDALDAGPYRAAGLDHTVAGGPLGTPAYMAPEQAAGEAVDERADVYALGAILYHVVSGAIPHEGTTLDEMVRRVVRGDVRPLTERVPDVPRDLAAILNRAMARARSIAVIGRTTLSAVGAAWSRPGAPRRAPAIRSE